jgi:signal transduction histidine kinase
VSRPAAEWTAAVAAVVITTAAVATFEMGALRHLLVIPTAWCAARYGVRGGLAIAALAMFLEVPCLLPPMAMRGVDPGIVDGVATFSLLLVVGGLAGALSDRARRRLTRYTAAVALQQALSSGTPLAQALGQVSESLREVLSADAVEVIVRRQGSDYIGASGPLSLRPATIGAEVAERARTLFVADLPEGRLAGRPRRLLIVPLRMRGAVIGMIGAERRGDFPRDDRAALEALAVVLALALENARLGEQLEAKVSAATERLRELDRAKTEFVAAASHELRTPLTSLCGFSELLLARQLPEHQRRRFITVIHTEATRLGRIIDDLLDLSRIESGRGPELSPVSLAVVPTLEAAAELFRGSGGGHRFRIVTEADLPPVLGDPDAVGRILVNLVSNAVKYSPPGTDVRLLAARAGEYVDISVEDDGIGIPEHALGQIFDRYYRVSRRPGGPPGLGLGLSLVKSLVESQGGSIRVDSSGGRGSRFTVSLPAVHGDHTGDDA